MPERVKYCAYERYPGNTCWRWCGSYLTLTEAWLSLPLWREPLPGVALPPVVEVVKLSVDLVAPITLYSDTIQAHAVHDPRLVAAVPPLRRLPVRPLGVRPG